MLRPLFINSCILSCMILTAIALFYIDYQRFLHTPIPVQAPFIFTIDPGMSFSEVNKKLDDNNLISHSKYFEILARVSSSTNRIKSGEYKISPGLTPEALLELFITAKVIQYSFTLIEGWQVREMLSSIRQSEVLVNTLSSGEPEHLMERLGYIHESPEGLFFPDTYYFPKGTTDIDFLKRAYQRLQAVLNEEWENRSANLPYPDPYQALIMASIIEKETGLASERKTIAGVFVRRLNKRMKLQTDPTVIFAMGGKFNGNLRKKDLAIDSPYNTYRYQGLPPGPIALAGRAAIHAALHPEHGESLYFVARGDGSHHFSKSLTEHNKAVAKYQLKRYWRNR